jgi:hypothetical protein
MSLNTKLAQLAASAFILDSLLPYGVEGAKHFQVTVPRFTHHRTWVMKYNRIARWFVLHQGQDTSHLNLRSLLWTLSYVIEDM